MSDLTHEKKQYPVDFDFVYSSLQTTLCYLEMAMETTPTPDVEAALANFRRHITHMKNVRPALAAARYAQN